MNFVISDKTRGGDEMSTKRERSMQRSCGGRVVRSSLSPDLLRFKGFTKFCLKFFSLRKLFGFGWLIGLIQVEIGAHCSVTQLTKPTLKHVKRVESLNFGVDCGFCRLGFRSFGGKMVVIDLDLGSIFFFIILKIISGFAKTGAQLRDLT